MEIQPIRFFYSYSHADEGLRKKLDSHLSFLKRDSAILWSDKEITLGKDINLEIQKELNQADIILLLVSANFLSSFYCYEIEMKEAMFRHEKGSAIVIPVLLSDCVWENAPFAKLLAAPYDAKPIDNPKNWNTIDEAFTNVARSLKDVVNTLKKKRESNLFVNHQSTASEKVRNSKTQDDNTLIQSLEIFKQETEKLKYNSSFAELQRVELLKKELLMSLINEHDEKVKNIPGLRNKIPEVLFNRIFSEDKLDAVTINEIQNIRNDSITYHWYERKIIISALTLSLIVSKKFDRKKVNLLIDFLTHFEKNVWENALTGLVISLLYNKNKWEKFPELTRRLETLRELENVQDGLNNIDDILRLKLYKETLFNPKIYSQSFFQSPINCFLPFYEENPCLTNAIENNSSDIDPDFFSNYLKSLPFLDCYKYSICQSIEAGTAKVGVLKGKPLKEFVGKLNISVRLHPYQNLMAEYYNFFAHYQKASGQDIFKNTTSITKTSLKTIILDKIHELQLSAESAIQDKDYHLAILNLVDLLKIDPLNRNGLWLISICYQYSKKPDYNLAIKHFEQLRKLDESDPNVWLKLGECFSLQEKFTDALKYFQEACRLAPKNKEIFSALGNCYFFLENYNESLKVYEEGLVVYPKECTFLYEIGTVYSELLNYEKAIIYFLQALVFATGKEFNDCCICLASEYAEIEDFSNSEKYAKMAVKNDPKDSSNLMALGRVYLIGNIDLTLARKYLVKSLGGKGTSVVFGNLGHLELCHGNRLKAVEYYKKCVLMFDKIKEFVKRFDVDQKHMAKYGIGFDDYNSIKDEMVQYWHLNKGGGV